MNLNGNGKWQLAFWLMTGLIILSIVVITPSLVSAIVTNDRVRQTEDNRIEVKLDTSYEKLSEKMTCVREDIAQVKTKLGIRN